MCAPMLEANAPLPSDPSDCSNLRGQGHLTREHAAVPHFRTAHCKTRAGCGSPPHDSGQSAGQRVSALRVPASVRMPHSITTCCECAPHSVGSGAPKQEPRNGQVVFECE